MENKFTLYLGLNDKDKKRQVVKTKKALKELNGLLLGKYELDGATIQEGNGVYKHQNGKTVKEKTIIITLLNVDEHIIMLIIRDLKKSFNQESILKEKAIMEYSFE